MVPGSDSEVQEIISRVKSSVAWLPENVMVMLSLNWEKGGFYKDVELAWGRSVNNWATPSSCKSNMTTEKEQSHQG